MDISTPTDRPKSVCNRCVIEVLVAFFVLSRCFLDVSVGVGAFVIELSQISSFFSFFMFSIYTNFHIQQSIIAMGKAMVNRNGPRAKSLVTYPVL